MRELRISNGMTQQEVAKRLGLSASTIGMYEQGRRTPDNETIRRICEEFDTTSDYLLETGLYLKAQTDLIDYINRMKNDMLNNPNLTLDGERVPAEDIEKVIEAVKIGVSILSKKKEK